MSDSIHAPLLEDMTREHDKRPIWQMKMPETGEQNTDERRGKLS